MRAIIVDDERKSREVLVKLIEELGEEITIINQADSVDEGFEVINKGKPDVVFLDVEMLDGTGFNLLEKISEISFKVIFTTAYDKYAIKAFRYSALDFLLKPINIDELEDAIKKARGSINEKYQNQLQIENLLHNFKDELKPKRMIVKGANNIDFVNVDEIIRCKADTSYTEIILTNKKVISAAKPLKEFDFLLSDETFFRVSKSYLINTLFVESYKKESGMLTMKDGITIEVSRRRKKDFMEMIQN